MLDFLPMALPSANTITVTMISIDSKKESILRNIFTVKAYIMEILFVKQWLLLSKCLVAFCFRDSYVWQSYGQKSVHCTPFRLSLNLFYFTKKHQVVSFNSSLLNSFNTLNWLIVFPYTWDNLVLFMFDQWRLFIWHICK